MSVALHGPLRAPAARLTLWWVGLYTAGLAAEARALRRQEIESDLWEHQSDRLYNEGAAPAETGLDVLSRWLRGVPADIFWRFNVEGPKVQIKIPVERIAGVMLLALVVLIFVGTATNYIDTSAGNFRAELQRLANEHGESTFESVSQLIAGLLVIGAGVGFALALRARSTILATLSGVGLICAGLLLVVAAAMNFALLDLAKQFGNTTGAEADSLVAPARALAVLGTTLQQLAGGLLLGSVYLLAVLAARSKLVARWLSGLAVVSAAAFGGSLVVAIIDGTTRNSEEDTLWWPLFAGGIFLALIWLIVAGAILLFRRGAANRGDGVDASDPQPAPGAALASLPAPDASHRVRTITIALVACALASAVAAIPLFGVTYGFG